MAFVISIVTGFTFTNVSTVVQYQRVYLVYSLYFRYIYNIYIFIYRAEMNYNFDNHQVQQASSFTNGIIWWLWAAWVPLDPTVGITTSEGGPGAPPGIGL